MVSGKMYWFWKFEILTCIYFKISVKKNLGPLPHFWICQSMSVLDALVFEILSVRFWPKQKFLVYKLWSIFSNYKKIRSNEFWSIFENSKILVNQFRLIIGKMDQKRYTKVLVKKKPGGWYSTLDLGLRG